MSQGTNIARFKAVPLSQGLSLDDLTRPAFTSRRVSRLAYLRILSAQDLCHDAGDQAPDPEAGQRAHAV